MRIDSFVSTSLHFIPSRFFHSLGTVFGFVASDVDSKIKILDSYRADENIGSHYETLKSMVEYEEKENLLRDKKRPSGARTILRLHRALKFFSTFIREVSLVEDSACTGPLARECYKKTLAKYHTWLIQKTASVAMYALPTRDGLVEKAFLKTDFESSGDKQAEWKRHSDEMDKMAKFADRVYDLVDEYFNEKNLHDLP